MRSILIEVGDFHRGGLAKWCCVLALALKKADCKVTVFCVGRKGYYAFKTEQGGVRVYGSDDGKPSFYEEILHDRRVDVVLSFLFDRDRSCIASLGIPNVVVIDSPHHLLEAGGRDKLVASDADVSHYIATNSVTGRLLSEALGIASERLSIIPKSIDPEHPFAEFSESSEPLSRATLGIPETHKIFLLPASFIQRKGHFILAEAVEMLQKDWDDFTVVCIGDVMDQAYYDTFADHIRQAGLDGRIKLMGYRRDAERFFDFADAIVLPFLAAGWSMSMNEALAVGRRVIVTDACGADIAEDIGGVVNTRIDFTRLSSEEYASFSGRRDGFGELSSQIAQEMLKLKLPEMARPAREVCLRQLHALSDLGEAVIPGYLRVMDGAVLDRGKYHVAVLSGLLRDNGRISMEYDDLVLRCEAYARECEAYEVKIAQKNGRIADIQAELDQIHNSKFWALARLYYQHKDQPPLSYLLNALKNIKQALKG